MMRFLSKLAPVLALLAMLTLTLGMTRVRTNRTILIDVDNNGMFTPQTHTVSVNETTKWIGLRSVDSIAPTTATGSDNPCDEEFAVAYDGVGDDFAGPIRYGVPGIALRGPAGNGQGGPEIVPVGTPCDNDPDPYIDTAPDPDEQFCMNQDGVPKYFPDEMWEYPEVMIYFVVVDWNELEETEGNYDFSTVIHELRAAAQHGKYVSLGIRTGVQGTPDWLDENATPPASLVSVEDNNESSPGPTNCGANNEIGIFTEAVNGYETNFNQLLTALAAEVNADQALRNALVSFQLAGMGNVSDEEKIPHGCLDDYVNCTAADWALCPGASCPPECDGTTNTCTTRGHCVQGKDGILDSYNGDDCTCNDYNLAVAGYTPAGMYAGYVRQGQLIHSLFGSNVELKWPLIDGGWPKSGPPTAPALYNFRNDTIVDQSGVRICASCIGGDDNAQVGADQQVDAMIATGQTEFGDRFFPMHNGLGWYPNEDPVKPLCVNNCTWGADMVGGVAVFPPPLVGPVHSQPCCPNENAVSAGITPPRHRMVGFQSNNAGDPDDPTSGGIDSAAAIESLFFNLTRNTPAWYVELYTNLWWYVHRTIGADGDMTPGRPVDATVDADVRFTKTPREWNLELAARRAAGVFDQEGLPASHQFRWTTPGTYHFYVPGACQDGVPQIGTVIVQ